MANEIRCRHTAGQNLYAVIWSGNTVWNGAAFEAPLAANWATYDLAMTEVPITGQESRYAVSFPAGITDAGQYTVEVYIRAGGSPAVSDAPFNPDGQSLDWDGTKLVGGHNQLDAGTPIDGKTLTAALKIIAATTAGKLPTGAGSGTETFYGLDGTTPRATITTDIDGNRTQATYP